METCEDRRVALFGSRRWAFITNHGRVLLAVARNPELRVSEIAAAAQITERYAYQVLSDLQQAGYLRRRRRGRCNYYVIDTNSALGDPMRRDQSLRELLLLVAGDDRDDLLTALDPGPRSD
jgi:MarR family